MIALSAEPISPGALLDRFCAGRSDVGAVASFTGLVREDGGVVQALELEAYDGFTQAAVKAMADDAVTRFGLLDVLIVHRIGRVAVGEPVVFVACAASHRRAALEACDQIMDYLKSRAPFWKKSHEKGGARWIEPTAADHADAQRWDDTTT